MNNHGFFFFVLFSVVVGAFTAGVSVALGAPTFLSFLLGLVVWTWTVFAWIHLEHRRIRRLYDRMDQATSELEEKRRKAWLS